jgi:hypothetical protein
MCPLAEIKPSELYEFLSILLGNKSTAATSQNYSDQNLPELQEMCKKTRLHG